MRQDIAGPETESTMPLWEGLEGVVREKAQEFIQQILEEEVTELLGSTRSGAGRASSARCVVLTKRRRLAPSSLAPRMSRATRLRPTRCPSSCSSAWIRGDP